MPAQTKKSATPTARWPRGARVIFASMETEYFAFGGLGAVMKLLPRELGPDKAAVIAPWYRNLVDPGALVTSGKAASAIPRFTVHVLVRGRAFPVEVLELVNPDGIRTWLLGSDTFFRAPENPYVNPCNPAAPLDPYRNPINGEKLTEDALFFCAAAPVALAELAREGLLDADRIVLHLQDWETAAIAQAVRRVPLAPAIASVSCALTVHNPYDKPLHPGNSPQVCDLALHLGLPLNRSVLEQCIPLLDAPVSTVSQHFAHELRNEVLYTQVFCPHLQRVFKRRGLVGIDNGIFGPADFPFSAKAKARADQGDFSVLKNEKWQRRIELGQRLETYRADLAASGKQVTWGGPVDLEDPACPVFFMLGRDDPRQKGFDVLVEAIRSMPKGAARYVFAVMPGDEGFLGLRFLEALAAERPDEVCVFPFRVEKQIFQALQRGSSFLVMGSMYEPFGAANEGYLLGIPVVARATGGLIQQVAPHPECLEREEILSLYGRQLVRKVHKAIAKPTGILFREQVSFSEESDGWRDIVDCGYWDTNPKGDRAAARRDILLFRRMADSAAAALRLAVRVYRDQDQYAAMIHHGWSMLGQFEWKRAVAAYRKHLYRAG